MKIFKLAFIFSLITVISACSSNQRKRTVVVDNSSAKVTNRMVKPKPRSRQQIQYTRKDYRPQVTPQARYPSRQQLQYTRKSTRRNAPQPLSVANPQPLYSNQAQPVYSNQAQPLRIEMPRKPSAPVKGNVWEVLANNFSMGEHYHRAEVERQVTRLEYNEDYFDLIQQNAKYYLPYIINEVQKRGMPMEIALLPIIESSLNPFAVSRSNAKGLWQFIPSTGHIYDLYGNHWEDDRRDVIRSTQAGLDYLEKLHSMFGDWSLAMGAYNGGPGTIQRAQKKNERYGRDSDYWSLKIYRETREYVPKILAMARVIKDPSMYGITLEPLASSTLNQHPIMGAVSLTQVANCAQMDFNDFYRYNAQYRRVNTDYKQHHFVLPDSKSSTFNRNIAGGISKCKQGSDYEAQSTMDRIAGWKNNNSFSSKSRRKKSRTASKKPSYSPKPLSLASSSSSSPRFNTVAPKPLRVSSARSSSNVNAKPLSFSTHKPSVAAKPLKLSSSRARTQPKPLSIRKTATPKKIVRKPVTKPKVVKKPAPRKIVKPKVVKKVVPKPVVKPKIVKKPVPRKVVKPKVVKKAVPAPAPKVAKKIVPKPVVKPKVVKKPVPVRKPVVVKKPAPIKVNKPKVAAVKPVIKKTVPVKKPQAIAVKTAKPKTPVKPAIIKKVVTIKAPQPVMVKPVAPVVKSKPVKTVVKTAKAIKQPVTKVAAKSTSKVKKVHTLKAGETIWRVSYNYGVALADLKRWNNITDTDNIATGRKLVIWK